jgi:hypothetical protein
MFSLATCDQERVREVIKTGQPREVTRAHALNMRHKGGTTIEVADYLELTPRTIINLCTTYSELGIERALHDDPRPGRPPEFDDRVKAKIVATVCSEPPEGFDRWTLVLLKEAVEENGIVESISKESLRIILREHDLKPWQQKMWCIPTLSEEYIERMEDVLNIYELPYNAKVPVVCMDEKAVMLHGETRSPIAMEEGKPRKVDNEYIRNGTANVFHAVEPKAGRYFTQVTDKRDCPRFAEFLAEIAIAYPSAKKIILVMDNLNTHKKKSLIDSFGEEEGTKLWERFDVHYTPKHGSWLNQAEIAIGMFTRQCLGGTRIPDFKTLKKKTAAWTRAVNDRNVTINWSFTAEDARDRFDYG